MLSLPLSWFQKCDAAEHKVLVVSLCAQSLPFFAVKFDLDIAEATRKLCGFLKSLGEFHDGDEDRRAIGRLTLFLSVKVGAI